MPFHGSERSAQVADDNRKTYNTGIFQMMKPPPLSNQVLSQDFNARVESCSWPHGDQTGPTSVVEG